MTKSNAQITRIEHYAFATTYIREMIDLHDEFVQNQLRSRDDDPEAGLEESCESRASTSAIHDTSISASGTAKFPKVFDAGNVVLSSRRSVTTFEALKSEQPDHPVLKNLHEKLSTWLSNSLVVYHEALPEGGRVRYQPNDEVRLHHYRYEHFLR